MTAAPSVAALLAARADDGNVGLVLDDRSWTWREVVAESARRASWLRSVLDPDRPPHVGVLMQNVPDHVFSIFGAALAGACVVGLNDTRRGAELLRDVEHTDCQLVLTDTAHEGQVPAALLATDAPWAGYPAELPADLPGPQTLLVLIFTSGSTSAPKAVRRTSGPIAAAAGIGFTPDDALYCAMPLAHGNALFANLFPALAGGARIVLRERFSASRWLDDVRRHDVTFANTVGRALGYVLETPPTDHDRDHRLRVVLAPEASPADAAAFGQRFGTMVITGYGQSEGGITLLPSRREGALGRAPDGTDIVVVDPRTGTECPVADIDEHGLLRNADAAIGELVRRDGHGAFEGYYRNAEADDDRRRNGWYWSGDLAYRDADGVFYFAGRVGDWLRVDAENFAAAPVERILGRHPDVAAVAVVGVPDPQAGDQVLAVVEPAPGRTLDLDGLPAWLAAQPDLGTKWAPRFVRVTSRLPVTGNDKVDRRALREQAWLTEDPVWWRPGREASYRPFTADDRDALAKEFARHGRMSHHPADT